MQADVQEIQINGITYVPKNNQSEPAEKLDGMPYVIVRTYSAGVFAGYLKSRNGKEVTLLQARRLWAWYGAASLSQLAMEGVKKPNDCKFPIEVPTIDLTEAIEITPCAEKCKKSIASVPVWSV